jgi:hypothetical protein
MARACLIVSALGAEAGVLGRGWGQDDGVLYLCLGRFRIRL